MERKFYEEGDYEQWVEIWEDKIKYNCTCLDFTMRKLKLEEKGADSKAYCTGPCKHLRRLGFK